MRRDHDDAWYDSEESTRVGMIDEMRRIRERTKVRPWPVIALAAFVTLGITYRYATHKPLVEAEVVLALTEGSLSARHNGIQVDELKQYVSNVLMPNARLGEIIQHRGLFRLRPGFGLDAAIAELREQVTIEIWKNSFSYNDILSSDEHSARIGITVASADGDEAYELARDLATVVTETAQGQHMELAQQLARRIASRRESLDASLDELSAARTEKEHQLTDARTANKDGLVQALVLEISQIDRERRRASDELSALTDSRVSAADRFATAGLDMSCEIVEERRPEKNDHRGFVLAMVIVVVGFGALLGSALVVGAFDSRVHDTDDVERLGLPLLGHVPRFPGDEVGSLEARGVKRRRNRSVLHWRD